MEEVGGGNPKPKSLNNTMQRAPCRLEHGHASFFLRHCHQVLHGADDRLLELLGGTGDISSKKGVSKDILAHLDLCMWGFDCQTHCLHDLGWG